MVSLGLRTKQHQEKVNQSSFNNEANTTDRLHTGLRKTDFVKHTGFKVSSFGEHFQYCFTFCQILAEFCEQ